MDIRAVSAFVQLGISLNYQQAAAACKMTVAELKNEVEALEQELDVTIVREHGDKAQLTLAGQAVFVEAQQISGGWDRLREIIANRKKQAAMTAVNLAVLPLFAGYDAAAVVDTLAKQQKVNVGEEDDPYQALLAGTGDVAFFREIDGVDRDKLETITVDTDQLAVYIPARDPLSKKKSLKLTDLQAEKFLTLNHGTAMAEYLQRVCDDADLFVYSVFEGKREQTLVKMVALGMGVSLLMEKAVQGDYDHDKVVQVPIEPVITCPLLFARLKDAQRTPEQEAFWQGLQQAFSKK